MMNTFRSGEGHFHQIWSLSGTSTTHRSRARRPPCTSSSPPPCPRHHVTGWSQTFITNVSFLFQIWFLWFEWNKWHFRFLWLFHIINYIILIINSTTHQNRHNSGLNDNVYSYIFSAMAIILPEASYKFIFRESLIINNSIIIITIIQHSSSTHINTYINILVLGPEKNTLCFFINHRL